MVSLKLQKRLAASIIGCGLRKVWMDPNEASALKNGKTRKDVRKFFKDGLIVRRENVVHSRWRANKRAEAKSKGRHTGFGSRRGTREARFPSKLMWVRRMRVLRRFLRKYRAQGKLDKHIYHGLYVRAKGNEFKNKRVLMETIFREKAEIAREQKIAAQAQVRREKLASKKARVAAKNA